MKNYALRSRIVKFFTKSHHYDSFLPHIVAKVLAASTGQIVSQNDARQIAASGRVKINGLVVKGVTFVVPEGTHEILIEGDEHSGGYRTPHSYRLSVNNMYFDA